MNESERLPSFNGWRAVAILLVLARHMAFINGVPPGCARLFSKIDGELGVRFFFTISGFLITWLMVKEEHNLGRISLKVFYARRAVRILPVYLFFLVVLAVLQTFGLYFQSGFVWFQTLAFIRNFYQTGEAGFPTSAHLWSLSVEEQFYFLWPLGFLMLRNSPVKRIKLLVVAIIFSAVWKIFSLLGAYNQHLYFLFEPHSTFLHLDCLAYGCIGALLFDTREEQMRRFFEKYSLPIFMSSGALILIPEICGLGIALQSFGFIFLLLQSVLLPRFAPFRILNIPWMVRIGVLSYSIYIWQQPIVLHWPARAWWFLALPVILLAAWVSYSLLEKPFFGLRSKLRRLAQT